MGDFDTMKFQNSLLAGQALGWSEQYLAMSDGTQEEEVYFSEKKRFLADPEEKARCMSSRINQK
jgi:hypothetical protein